MQNAFTAALEAEGLLEDALQRAGTGRVDPGAEDGLNPILLAVSDNGSQMISRDTRTFMTLLAIAQHFGRPSTPTDQAWIESLNGTIKAEWPYLLAITDPAVPRAELDVVQHAYNSVRLHQGIGYVTPNDEHERPRRSDPPGPPRRHGQSPPPPPCPAPRRARESTHPRTPRCWAIDLGSRTLTQTHITSSGDIDPSDGVLTVRLDPLPTRRATAAIAQLCQHLTATGTRYPGTDLLLRYEIKSRP